jgi:pimeloyl-ACP methyl ester carboxylesterase
VDLSHYRAGKGEPLVLIHGIASHWQAWKPVMPALERERDVIALDLPGFGGSPSLPIGVAPNAPALADAVAAFLDSLGIERPVVGGNSLGGWVALELAKRGRARAVVGVSPSGFFSPLERRWGISNLAASVWMTKRWPHVIDWFVQTPRRRKLAFGSVIGHPDRMTVEDAREMVGNAAASVGFPATRAALRGERFTGGEQVDVPVTLLWGTKDVILPPWQATRALRELPTARHLPLRGAGHVPMWDEPDAIVRELLAA